MKDLNLYITLKAFDKTSKQLEGIRNAGGKLTKAFDENLASLHKLNKQMKAVDAYRKQERALTEVADKINKAKHQAKEYKEAWRQAQKAAASGESVKNLKKLAEQHEKTTRTVRALMNEHKVLKTQLGQANGKLKEAGISSKNLATKQDELRKKADALNDTLNTQSSRLKTVAERQGNLARRKEILDSRLSRSANASMAGYVGINAAQRAAHGLTAPIREYIEQEKASTNLEVTMMRADGGSGAFAEINKQAIKLGNILPGTTTDFINLAKALKEQGVYDDTLLNGGLKGAAQLAVLMGMGQEEGGTFTARMIEAHGLNPDDISKAADMTQRAYYTFGLKKEDMAAAMSYYAPKVNAMGLTGNENYQTLLAIQGMAARQGLEGSMFGTNFSMLLGQLGEGPRALEIAKNGMKAEARDVLDKANIKFDFYDENGNFKGLEDMIAEMEKLRIIEEKFGEKDALLVARQLFGEQGGRPALMLAKQGVTGLQAAKKDMDKQADLVTRIEKLTSTLDASLEQLGGVSGQISGYIGSIFAGDIKELAKWAQEFLENTLIPFVENNKDLVKTIGYVLAGLTALAAIGGFALLVFAGLNSVFAITAFALSGVGGIFSWLGGVVARVGAAMLANPIIAIAAGIALAAYLIYDNWDGIVEFFSERWTAVRRWFSDTWALLKTDTTAGLLKIGAAILDWSPLVLFYKVFAGVMDYFGIELPDSLSEFMSEVGTKISSEILDWPITQAIMDIVGPAVQAAMDLIDSLAQAWANFKAAFDSTGQIVATTMTTVAKSVAVGAKVADFASEHVVGKSPKELMDEGKNAISSVGDQIISGFKQGVQNFYEGDVNVAVDARNTAANANDIARGVANEVKKEKSNAKSREMRRLSD